MASALKTYGTLIGFVLVVVFFWIEIPDTFMTAKNWLNISQQVSMLAVTGAEKLLRREIDANAHKALLDELAAELPA